MDDGKGEVCKQALKLNVILRSQGIKCKLFYTRGGLDKVMKQAVEEKYQYAVLLGENEVANCEKHLYTIKDLNRRNQETLSLESLLQIYKESIVCFLDDIYHNTFLGFLPFSAHKSA